VVQWLVRKCRERTRGGPGASGGERERGVDKEWWRGSGRERSPTLDWSREGWESEVRLGLSVAYI
jgi:hypothetical protein